MEQGIYEYIFFCVGVGQTLEQGFMLYNMYVNKVSAVGFIIREPAEDLKCKISFGGNLLNNSKRTHV